MGHELGTDYLQFHQQLVAALYAHCKQLPPFHNQRQTSNDDDKLFLQRLGTLAEDLNASEQGYPLGQWVISTLVMRYPQLTPYVPRDLFWFFGGDCMHYLGEEEIFNFQRLDEIFYTQDCETDQVHSYEALRSTVLGLH